MSIIIMAMPIIFSETHTQGEVNKSLFAGNGKQVTLLLSLGSPPLVDRLWRADSRSRASQPVPAGQVPAGQVPVSTAGQAIDSPCIIRALDIEY